MWQIDCVRRQDALILYFWFLGCDRVDALPKEGRRKEVGRPLGVLALWYQLQVEAGHKSQPGPLQRYISLQWHD